MNRSGAPALILTSLALALAVGGCAATPTTAETTSPQEQPTVDSPPTPEVQLPGPLAPTLADLTVSPDGLALGSELVLTVGQPVSTGVSVGIVDYDENACGEMYGGDAWVSAFGAGEDTFTVVQDEGEDTPIQAINVWSDEVVTAEGIGVGSTADELEAAYPSLEPVDQTQFDVYTLPGDAGSLAFLVAITTPSYFDGFAEGEVMTMRVTASNSSSPAVLWVAPAGTDRSR